MELFTFARFHARPGNEAAVAEAILTNLPPSREEPGCLDIHAIHALLPHTVRLLARVEPLIDHPLDVARTERIC